MVTVIDIIVLLICAVISIVGMFMSNQFVTVFFSVVFLLYLLAVVAIELRNNGF